MLNNKEKYYSQLGQDKFVDEYFKNKTNGFYVDIGAGDGIGCSNTKFFESFRNWNGICIEPGPNEFKKLTVNRKSININVCVSNYDGESEYTYIEGYAGMLSGLSEYYNKEHEERINKEINQYGGIISKIKTPVCKLQTILDEYSTYEVDYCSIDTEGSELQIIQSIDFDKTNIKIFSIENNYKNNNIQKYLESKNYILETKIYWDDIFIKLS